MFRVYRHIVMVVLLLGIIPAAVMAQDTAAAGAFAYLEYPVAPRLAAMANAGTGAAAGGFAYVNPAQITLAQNRYVGAGYSPMPGDFTASYVEGVVDAKDYSFGVNVSNYLIDGIVPADEHGPNYTIGSGSSGFSLVSLNVARKTGKASFALMLSGMQERIVSSTRYGYSLSAGTTYILLPGRLTLGAAALHLIGTMTAFTYGADETGIIEPIPRIFRFGAGYSDTLKNMPLQVNCDIVYRDKGTGMNRLTVPVGIELKPTDYIALRLGKRFNFETDIVNFGAGLTMVPLTFDFAVAVSKLLGDIEYRPMFSLTYMLPNGAAKKS